MKVKDLIKELQKLPKNLTVYYADHDHSAYEINNIAGSVTLMNRKEIPEHDDEGKAECLNDMPNKYVCIRP